MRKKREADAVKLDEIGDFPGRNHRQQGLFPAPLLAGNETTRRPAYWKQKPNPSRPWQPMKLPCSLPQIRFNKPSPVLDELAELAGARSEG